MEKIELREESAVFLADLIAYGIKYPRELATAMSYPKEAYMVRLTHLAADLYKGGENIDGKDNE